MVVITRGDAVTVSEEIDRFVGRGIQLLAELAS